MDEYSPILEGFCLGGDKFDVLTVKLKSWVTENRPSRELAENFLFYDDKRKFGFDRHMVEFAIEA